MSKQSEAKLAQGYIPKPTPNVCSRCNYFALDKNMVSYGLSNNTYTEEKNIRCELGGFAVKKNSTCNKFEVKK